MIEHRKARIMNLLGSIGLLILGVVVVFEKVSRLESPTRVSILVYFIGLAFVAFGTARGLSANAKPILRKSMLVVNWILIVLGLIGCLIVMFLGEPLSALLGTTLVFVLPELINIRALRSLMSY